MTDRIGVAHLFPGLAGAYGDSGNVMILGARAVARGIGVDVVSVEAGEPAPAQADIYVLGGGEHPEQNRIVAELEANPAVLDAIQHGAVVFAVGAGMQVLGRVYPAADGAAQRGLGVFDIETTKNGERAVGPLETDSHESLGLGRLRGHENHFGRTALGPGAQPLGHVQIGHGNGADGVEGVWQGHAVGTYLHGPALAANPALADMLLTWATGLALDPYPSPFAIPAADPPKAGSLVGARPASEASSGVGRQESRRSARSGKRGKVTRRHVGG